MAQNLGGVDVVAAPVAPEVTRAQRIWGWVIGFALACALFGWMMIESRAMARA